MITTQHWTLRSIAATLAVMLIVGLAPLTTRADDPPPATSTEDCNKPTASGDNDSMVCTNFKCLKKKSEDGKDGMLTGITKMIKDITMGASQKLYESFIKSDAYQKAVGAAMTLMFTFYAVAFTIGIVQPSFGQLLQRLIKVGIIFAMIAPGGGWTFFNEYVVKFFNDGTDELIGGVMSIGTGGAYVSGESPFKQLDSLAKWMISPDMIVALMGTTFASGPYGLTVGALMAFAFGGVIKLLIKALQIYALSFIMRALLLGIAPIFIVFLLFDKTKGLFTGWLNSLVNLSLQPILFFTFLSFFIVMILGASKDMLGFNNGGDGIEFCWTEYANTVGSTNKTSFWRIKARGDKAPKTDAATWRGAASCLFDGRAGQCEEFPINVVDILSFLILIYVATRFADVVDNLANEISNVAMNLDVNSKMSFREDQKAGDSLQRGASGQPVGSSSSQQAREQSAALVHPRDRH